MKRLTLLTLITGIALTAFTFSDFFSEQLRYPRVRQANASKGGNVAKLLSAKSIPIDNFDLFIRIFKEEQTVEVWAKDKSKATYEMVTSYPFCASTGVLGPKRKSGDKQTPEGFYTIDRFNPESSYHLSFRVNYPNKSDLIFADVLNPGGDIFIHGDCITIGCVPIGDDNIEELYLMAARAKAADGGLNVHIFPNKMTDANYSKLKKEYAGNAKLLTFWSWLKPGYDTFEETKKVPAVTIAEDGAYEDGAYKVAG